MLQPNCLFSSVYDTKSLGDIAFRFLDLAKEKRRRRQASSSSSSPMSSPHVTVYDINASMLEVGRARAEKLGHTRESGLIDWRQGDAMRLPFEDGQFDAYTIAFGIRNVVRIDEARRLLIFVVAPLRMFGFLNFFLSLAGIGRGVSSASARREVPLPRVQQGGQSRRVCSVRLLLFSGK